jgi:hypothetical protein
MSPSIDVGDLARDRVSGFEGIVTGRSVFLNGCARILITPRGLNDKGEPKEAHWFDDLQCERVQTNAYSLGPDRKTGGPQNDPPAREDAAV